MAPPTDWEDVGRLLDTAELFWISTVREDQRPHVTPLPAVWHANRLHFCTGASEQKALNIIRNPRVALTTGTNLWRSGLDVVVEGRARRVTDPEELLLLANEWRAKYDGDWDFEVEGEAFRHQHGGAALVFEVRPEKVLAFAKDPFAQTRFRFDPPPDR